MCASPCSGNQPPLTQSGICIIPLQLFPRSFGLDMQIPPFSLAAAIPLCQLVSLFFSFQMFSSNKGISFASDALFHEEKIKNTLKSPHRLVSPGASIPFQSSSLLHHPTQVKAPRQSVLDVVLPGDPHPNFYLSFAR